MGNWMANVGLMLAGSLLVALSVLIVAYLIMEKQRGKIMLRPLSVKANVTANAPFALMAIGAMLVITGYLSN